MSRKRSSKYWQLKGWRERWEPMWFQLLLWANGVDPIVYRYRAGEDFRSMCKRARKEPSFFPNNTTESRSKIALMLKLAVELDQPIAQYARQKTTKVQSVGDLPESTLRIANQLDELFCTYQWEHRAGIVIEGRGLRPYIRVRVRDDGTVPEGERLAVEALGDCAHAGLLSRFKVCECGCGLWFFESRLGKRYFSNSCRTRAAQSAPQYKENRRKYAKEYYEANFKRLRQQTGSSKKRGRKGNVAKKAR
jgi:hypothetical protein